MANRLYNQQVTPKGYKKGGSVRDTRKTEQMIGASISSKREKGRTRKMGGGMMMERPMMQKGGPSKKPKVRKIVAGGIGKAKDYPGIKKIIEMNKKGRKKFKMGGALKPVDPQTQKGLSKLPTKVRNKMGYMKKGGMVPNKKYIKKVAKELRRK